MAATPESKVKKVIKDWLKEQSEIDLWFFMPFSGGYGVVGIPDIVGCWNGAFFAVEVKADGGKTTPWQDRTLAAITKAGGRAGVARTLEEAQMIVLGRE
jgi:hypothetical protein